MWTPNESIVSLVDFLHYIRKRIRHYTEAQSVDVYIRAGNHTYLDEVQLIIIADDLTYTFLLNQADLDDLNKTTDFIMRRVYNERLFENHGGL